ncbi:MAG TPA: CRISPR-associated helicase/endonuclease Cas3, partial [Ruminococcus sp.]|nr:CRISPR-associated helicase/endonuclease Cas3 [Ruminococcus sp.]
YNRICPVYLINFKAENLRGLEEIKTAQRVSRQIIDNCDHDLLSVDVQTSYFTELFRQYSDKLSYNVSDGSSQTNLVELLSTDEKRFILRKETEPVLSQAFKTAGELFSVIDSNTKDIIVQYNKQSEWLISRLESQISPIEARELLRKAQKYTVSIYAGTEKALSEKGALHLNTLDKRFYNNEFGVDLEGAEQEVLIF